MAQAPILAAGGIVVKEGGEPLIAIVRLRKDKTWVLPKGKLKPNEDACAAAQREVREETGHDVSVHEFLGTMSHPVRSGRSKIVQFWRMSADGDRVHELMQDIQAVRWLPLDQAVGKLTHVHEQAFLSSIGPAAIMAARIDHDATGVPHAARMTLVDRIRAWFKRMMAA
jgi:8-oxo-dGTP diphosphatase